MAVRARPLRRLSAEELMLLNCGCWRRLLRVPWTARRSNQSILKEISPEYSLEGLMLKLKLQYFGQLMEELTHWKRPWCWERLKAGGEGNDRRWDGWMASQTLWTWVWVNSGSWWWTGKPGVLQSMGQQRVGHDWATELNWSRYTETFPLKLIITYLENYTFVNRIKTSFFLSNPSQNWKLSGSQLLYR